MTPDYQKAATKALETLIKNNITSTPIDPLPVLKKLPGVIVVSYETFSKENNQDRKCVMSMVGETNQDAMTIVNIIDGKPRYLVTYNQMLPYNLFQRALARELGHIVLGHDGTLPEEVRYAEAKTFAHHLICPRPLLYAIKQTGIRLTKDLFGNITGCYDYCLSCLRKQPAIETPVELNRAVRDQFMPYILNLFEYQRYATHKDGSAIADFGTYMEGYAE